MIEQYKKNIEAINKIYKERQNNREERDKALNKNRIVLRDQVYELESIKRGQDLEISAKTEGKDEKIKEKLNPLLEYNNKVIRILRFIDLNRGPGGTINFTIEGNVRNSSINEIENIKNDYMNLKIVTTKNRKPTNMYSLCLALKHIFTEKLLNKDYGYSYCDEISSCSAIHRKSIISKPTTEALEQWYSKNRDELLKPYLEEYEQVAKEYKEVKENQAKDHDWNILYLEWKINCYKYSHSRGTETEEYKKLNKELKHLKSRPF